MRFLHKYDPTAAASKDGYRKHLTRVLLDTEHSRLVSTDGHRLLCVPVMLDEGDQTRCVDAATVTAARKVAGKAVKVVRARAGAVVQIPADVRSSTAGDDLPFPPYQHVIPRPDREHIRVGLNARYLYELAQALGNGECVYLDIATTGKYADREPIVVRTNSEGKDSEGFAVLMPCAK